MFLWGLQCTSIFLLIPFIFSESGNGFSAMFIAYLWELPATLIVIGLIDSKKYGGRKRIIIFGLSVYVLAEFLIFYFKAPSVVFGMTLIRMSDKLVWMTIN